MENRSRILYLTLFVLLQTTSCPLFGQLETPGRATNGSLSSRSTPTPQEVPRDLFLSGSVVLQGGEPLPGRARVRLICNGAIRQVVETTEEGRFDFVLGSNAPNSATVDPSIVGTRHPGVRSPTLSGSESRDPFRTAGTGRMMPFNRVDLSSCQCDALLPGYQGAPIKLGFRSVFDNPDIGVITLQPVGKVKGTTVSLNTLSAPKNAKAAFEKAGKELNKKKVDYSKVKKHLEEATEIYPDFAAAWQLLGQTNLAMGDEESARKAFREALARDPDYVMPYIALAELEIQANRWTEAAQLTGSAIELNPYVIRAHYFHALAQFYLQHDAEAEEAIRKVQASQEASDYPACHYLLGGILGDRGEYEAAAAEFRLFLGTNPHINLVNEVKGRLQEWGSKGLIKPVAGESRPPSTGS